MKYILSLFLLSFYVTLLGAQNSDVTELKPADSLYKEDQFYVGVTYNLLENKPKNLSQNGFSSGFHFGFIKDMPINNRRNLAIGLGVGVSLNSFNQNMFISEAENKSTVFSILDNNAISFSKNKFYMHMLEIPIELRWRTSTASEYKFWRMYAGFKLGYVVRANSKYEGDPNNLKLTNIDAFNDFQYGLTFSAGYNTWNFYFYYALNPILKSDSKLNGMAIDMNALKVGLMFYIL